MTSPVNNTIDCTDVAVRLESVCFRREGRDILKDVNLSISRGDFVAVTGPNGGGKTTMLKLILGLGAPTSGVVTVNVPRNAIGYLPQKNTVDAHFPISVREVVASGLLARSDMSDAERARRVDDTIARVELLEHADRPIGRLSGGQVQRALLGRAIISQPALLVLDEPLSYIDKHFEAHIYQLLEQIAPDTTIILVSHEMSIIAGMANRHFIIDRTASECTAHHHGIHSDCDD